MNRVRRGGIQAQAPHSEIERLEDKCDVLSMQLARIETANEERIPFSVIARLAAGENPVKVWREYRGMSVDDLADRAGTVGAEIQHIEANEPKNSIERMAPIAQALGVDLDDLLAWSQAD